MTTKLGPCHARVLKPQAGVLKKRNTHSRNRAYRVACTPGESGDYYAPPQAQRGRGAAWSSTPTEPPVASIRSRSLPLGGSCDEQRATVQARGWQAAAPDLSTCSCTGTGMAERAFSSSACSSALAILIGGRTYAEGTTAGSRLGQPLAHVSASGLAGGSPQRQIIPRAAQSFGEPRQALRPRWAGQIGLDYPHSGRATTAGAAACSACLAC